MAQCCRLLAKGLAALCRVDEAESAFDVLAGHLDSEADRRWAAAACQSRAEFFATAREDSERAAQAFDDCCARYPTSFALLQAASEFHDARGERERALDLWRRAATDETEGHRARVELASRLERAGRYDEAEEVLKDQALLETGKPNLAVWPLARAAEDQSTVKLALSLIVCT